MSDTMVVIMVVSVLAIIAAVLIAVVIRSRKKTNKNVEDEIKNYFSMAKDALLEWDGEGALQQIINIRTVICFFNTSLAKTGISEKEIRDIAKCAHVFMARKKLLTAKESNNGKEIIKAIEAIRKHIARAGADLAIIETSEKELAKLAERGQGMLKEAEDEIARIINAINA